MQLARYLAQEPINKSTSAYLEGKTIRGAAIADLEFRVPLSGEVDATNIDARGVVTISELEIDKFPGKLNVRGGKVRIQLAERTEEATGEILVNGVPIELRWLKLLDRPDSNAPIRFSANLDAADREQLGIIINHIVSGRVPTQLDVYPASGGGFPEMHLKADLSSAELKFEQMSWLKPVGQRAVLEADVRQGSDETIELQNFKILGDPIGVEGWLSIGSDGRLLAFKFPEFQVDLSSQLDLEGELTQNEIWKVTARAKRYDGRKFFRSLFAAEKLGVPVVPPERRRRGIDMEAEIETVLGYSNVTMHNVRLKTKKRGTRLTAFEAFGEFASNATIGVRMTTNKNGKRQFLAESSDAGKAFALVGFYSSVRGGRAALRVNIDGQGRTSKTGTLWTEDFVVLGDPIISDGGSGRQVNEERSHSQPRREGRRVERLKLNFDRLYVPFSVGQGRFKMYDSFVNGPALGATMRGHVDFNRQTVQMNGTYVPLYGLNAMLGGFPIIGTILTGRPGEGIIGLTFAVTGRLDNPQVVVNPISAAIPGIFRQIVEFQSPDPPIGTTVVAPAARKPPQDVVGTSASQVFTQPSSGVNGWVVDSQDGSENWPIDPQR